LGLPAQSIGKRMMFRKSLSLAVFFLEFGFIATHQQNFRRAPLYAPGPDFLTGLVSALACDVAGVSMPEP
jgi:hypothetical protein